jgi:hypothetical protein
VRHTARLVNHHADGSNCPPEHRHTTTGKPLHPDCPGRAYSSAACSCGEWQMSNLIKGYVNECRKRHLASHTESFSAARELLHFD